MSENSNGDVKEAMPNTEVVAKAKRKRFTAAEKQRILREVDACQGSGEVGALLRRALKQRPAYLPLEFDVGQDAQVDWGEAQAEINGVRQTVQMFVMRLNYSKVRFVVAFPFQKQEAFFEGYIQVFHFFGGVPRRSTYDNLKTAVFRILEGHHRQGQLGFIPFSQNSAQALFTFCSELYERLALIITTNLKFADKVNMLNDVCFDLPISVSADWLSSRFIAFGLPAGQDKKGQSDRRALSCWQPNNARVAPQHCPILR